MVLLGETLNSKHVLVLCFFFIAFTNLGDVSNGVSFFEDLCVGFVGVLVRNSALFSSVPFLVVAVTTLHTVFVFLLPLPFVGDSSFGFVVSIALIIFLVPSVFVFVNDFTLVFCGGKSFAFDTAVVPENILYEICGPDPNLV